MTHLIRQLNWEVLSHLLYSPDLAPIHYHIFRSLKHSTRSQNSYIFLKVDLKIGSLDKENFQLTLLLLDTGTKQSH